MSLYRHKIKTRKTSLLGKEVDVLVIEIVTTDQQILSHSNDQIMEGINRYVRWTLSGRRDSLHLKGGSR